MNSIDISHSQEIYTISQLNREVRLLLEGQFAILWVEGEISNFTVPHSGHWYFSLKDAAAQVRCAMFRPQNRRLTFTPKDGMHVFAKVRISLYEGRGEFQLLVEHLEEAGAGKLQQAFEALKKRLSAAGLFAIEYKKKLPLFPQSIGVITSATGAAIRDILSVLKRRYACANVIIYPTLVQGELAAPHIVQAIQIANQRKECDVLILARGGGSLEDLWPFNDERVAYAIHHSVLPIISGVGHEIDFTIADFVADVRAATPTAAAELITPHQEELLATLLQQQKQLLRLMQHFLQQPQQQLLWLQKHLQQQHPKHRLAQQIQQVDTYEMTLRRLQIELFNRYRQRLSLAEAKLFILTPQHVIREQYHHLNLQHQQLQNQMNQQLQHAQQAIANLAAKLDALSPLATLQRGYAIATRAKDQSLIQDATQVAIGEKIHVQLCTGKLECRVDDNT